MHLLINHLGTCSLLDVNAEGKTVHLSLVCELWYWKVCPNETPLTPILEQEEPRHKLANELIFL